MEEKKEKKHTNTGVVFVAGKPIMNYVTSTMMQLSENNANTIKIKARGHYTSKAIDVAEIIIKRFMQGKIDYEEVCLDSEDFKKENSRDVRVSTIEIKLLKGGKENAEDTTGQ